MVEVEGALVREWREMGWWRWTMMWMGGSRGRNGAVVTKGEVR